MSVTRADVGKTVTDGERTGTLADLVDGYEDAATRLQVPGLTAFVRPEGGGIEWTADPEQLIPAS
ncbi:hypothetical protein OKJ48_36135 [Streptomyces kunmingensis]|uniref:Uncharacterized protein n=1 Tax=Streptomyces kunmingensis TaxID=68225 RepID=A0ABU6CLM6_9ACTN|nr:hypothetical protein [Streptomyces kunmingensis]MEB3965621.1 hypothetical protein [Streptomyces kunmingensis]